MNFLWEFWPGNVTVSGQNVDFLQTGAIERLKQNKGPERNACLEQFRYVEPSSPCDS